MNFLKKIKDFFRSIFTTKTEMNLEITIQENDVLPQIDDSKIYEHPVVEMAPEEDEHVPSNTITLKEAVKSFQSYQSENTDSVVTVKEIKSKSRTKKEKVVEEKPKDQKEKKSKKKS